MRYIFHCSIDGCDKPIRYNNRKICQMHYFRWMRNGTYDLLPPKHKEKHWKQKHSEGYVKVKYAGHPLSDHSGMVFEHRLMMFNKYGMHLPPCELCGAATSWFSRNTHVDHIDCNRANNHESNLRILCNSCNVRRNIEDVTLRPSAVLLTHDGKTLTCEQWSREPGVMLSGHAIRHRKRKGWSDYDCLFKDKVTHNGKRKQNP